MKGGDLYFHLVEAIQNANYYCGQRRRTILHSVFATFNNRQPREIEKESPGPPRLAYNHPHLIRNH